MEGKKWVYLIEAKLGEQGIREKSLMGYQLLEEILEYIMDNGFIGTINGWDQRKNLYHGYLIGSTLV